MEEKEILIDPDYHKIVDRIVIPPAKEKTNHLTDSNHKIIQYVSAIDTLLSIGCEMENAEIQKILAQICEELKTKGINYSAFCQYFNIHNVNYSVFQKLDHERQMDFLQFIVPWFIQDRHHTYDAHGYSDMSLQVMSDNYAHKRKGNYGANKIARELREKGILKSNEMPSNSSEPEMVFLLCDKDGKKGYQKFAKENGVSLSEEGKKTQKYPDALIKIGMEYFIVEQKNMKENGGGQDKQTLEITHFIDRAPEKEHLHYVTYVDGIYLNQMNGQAGGSKTSAQYEDIIETLKRYPSNFFVNSSGFSQMMDDFLELSKERSAHLAFV